MRNASRYSVSGFPSLRVISPTGKALKKYRGGRDVDGIVAYEVRDKALPSTGTWWEVCAVSWPSRNVVPIDRISATVPACL